MNPSPTRSHHSPRFKRAGCLLLILAGVLWLWLSAWGLGAFLVDGDTLTKVDAIIVLSGNNDRIAEASRLKKAGLSSWVILTQANAISPEMDARKLDVPGEMLLVAPGIVSSTYEEALSIRQVMAQRNLSSCIVVTDPFHTLRTRLIFNDVLRQTGIRVIVHPVPGHWYTSRTWWQSAEGIQVTIQEYIKLLAYLAGSRGD